ncbi:MAG TPA: glycine-rich protein, partial [Solirubrobacterales bacterium]|nr:glycine-rich protein [Solirubrobacterales bacterium]
MATADTETIGYTGGPQAWTVPLGVHSVEFDLYEAAGSNNGNSGFVGGKGGRAKATFDVSPGQLMRLYIGGTGGFLAGGWNGGGHGFAGGGGGTDLRIGGTGLGNRVLVAGGGGGVGNYGGASRGGDGGGLVGTSGTSPTAGAPGTQTEGGAGTWPGSLGQGGGGGGFGSGATRGGGGGGYYGGSTNDQEGGGGSGYGPSGTFFETGVRDGNGQAILTYTTVRYALGVDILGAGQGHVSSSPAVIDCGYSGRIDCGENFAEATQVTLTATAEPGSIFTGWSGAC